MAIAPSSIESMDLRIGKSENRARAGYLLLNVLGGHQDEAAARTCHGNGFDHFGRGDRPARPCTSPDLRSELPRLPAGLPEHGGLLLRVSLPNDGAVCRVGLGPLGTMRGQSILRRAECRAQQAPKAASAILNSVRFNGLGVRRPRGPSPGVTPAGGAR